MIDKHQITGITEKDIAYLKYNYVTSELVIGGHSDCIDFIDTIVEDYIKKGGLNNEHSQRARIRYTMIINKKIYRTLKTNLKETYADGFTEIENLDRRL